MTDSIDQFRRLAADAAASVGPPGYGAKIKAATQTLSTLIPHIAVANSVPVPGMASIMACLIGTMIRQGVQADQRDGLVRMMADTISHFAGDSEGGQ